MKIISIFRLTCTLILLILSGKQLFAQVATPNLFNSRLSYNPAVVALHEEARVAYIQQDGSGETKTIKNYYGYEYDTGDVEKITQKRKSVSGVVFLGDWAVEAFSDLSHKIDIENENNSGSSVSTAGNTYSIEKTLRSIMVGTSYNAELSWGVKIAQENETVETFSIENTDLVIGLGITYQLIDNLFLSLGSNMTKSEATGKVSNNWLEYYYGVGFGLEPNNDLKLRFEFNGINSPEDGAEESGGSAANNHRATEEMFLSAEGVFQQIKVTYRSDTYTVNPLSTRPSESKDSTVTTTLGVGYTFENPSAFVEVLQHTSERTRGDYTTTDNTSLELSVGILF